MTRALTLGALVTLCLGCEADARNDANLFLDRVGHIDLDDPVAERRERVDALARLPLEAEEVQSARDACVEAHRAVIEAEEASSAAREELGNDRETREGLAEVEANLRRSDRAVERARGLFSRCHRLTRGLELRYRPRR